MKRVDWKKRQTDHQAVLWVLGFYGVLALTGHGCPIRWGTGVPCPGCGLSRAGLALLRLDVPSAFTYHPMFWAVPLLGVFGWLYSRKPTRGLLWGISLLGVMFFVVYLVRLIARDPVLEIDIPSGLIFQAFGFFSKILRFS
ncbi:MAG: DUF2752 domain-containing protein [Hungatella sp.]|nr:DUF2752 domain-containing protein [Hungatella sp.]